MTLQEALGRLRNAYPSVAGRDDQIHFKYAIRGGVLLFEVRRGDRFFSYVFDGESVALLSGTDRSRLTALKTVGESFRPHAQCPSSPP